MNDYPEGSMARAFADLADACRELGRAVRVTLVEPIAYPILDRLARWLRG